MDVDFQIEVTDTSNVKSTINTEVEAKAFVKHWFISTEISDKVTAIREDTHMTNQTAKYQIYVTASQQLQTGGLSKLTDIMASYIEPINTESSKWSINIQNGVDKVPLRFDNNYYENVINASSI